jgi:hypothetical protein
MNKEHEEKIKTLISDLEDKEWEVEELRAIISDILPKYTSFLHQILAEFVSANLGLILSKDTAAGWWEFSELVRNKIKEKKKPVFSDFYKDLISSSVFSILSEREYYIPDWCTDGYGINFFEPNFEFSEEPEEFEIEISVLLYLLMILESVHLPITDYWVRDEFEKSLINELEEEYKEELLKLEYSKINQTVMKGVFHAGKMIERVKLEGQKRSDRPAMIGRLPKKNMVSRQQVIDAFFRTDREGKSKHAICEAVRKYLIEKETGRGTRAKEVYSVKQIGRILEPEFNK